MARWSLTEDENGKVQVQKDRRFVGGYPNLAAAQDAIRGQVGSKDKVTLVEPDGYPSNVTRTVRPRKGWRKD